MGARSPLPEALSAPPRGRVLVLAPHADDEVIGLGGTLALHAAQGDPVRVLVTFCADARRRAEARAGGAHLGVADYVFWGLPEGHQPSPDELEDGACALAGEVALHRPDIVYAPWIGEHHVDHHVLARAARRALGLAHFAGEAWGYEVWTPLVPTRVVDVSPVWEAKRTALREHASQVEHGDLEALSLGLALHRCAYLPRGARAGEAFAPLRPAERAA